jgi:hypothetical protein
MFFANLILKKLAPSQCPDNDHHNVDTIDGLVLPTITALAMAASSSSAAPEDIANAAAATAAVTRNSAHLEATSRVWSQLVAASLAQDDGDESASSSSSSFQNDLIACAKSLGMRRMPSGSSRQDEMTACYLDSSLPSTLDMIAKYEPAGRVRVWSVGECQCWWGKCPSRIHFRRRLGSAVDIARCWY